MSEQIFGGNATVAMAIEQNIESEAQARAGYYELISVLRHARAPQGDIDVVTEIISDELNHSEKLRSMLMQYSNIEPANS